MKRHTETAESQS